MKITESGIIELRDPPPPRTFAEARLGVVAAVSSYWRFVNAAMPAIIPHLSENMRCALSVVLEAEGPLEVEVSLYLKNPPELQLLLRRGGHSLVLDGMEFGELPTEN